MEEPKNGMEKVQPLFCPPWKQASDEEKSIANSQLRLVQISTPTRLTIWPQLVQYVPLCIQSCNSHIMMKETIGEGPVPLRLRPLAVYAWP